MGNEPESKTITIKGKRWDGESFEKKIDIAATTVSFYDTGSSEIDITPLLSLDQFGTGDFYFSTGLSIDEGVNLYGKKPMRTRDIPRGLWKQQNKIEWK